MKTSNLIGGLVLIVLGVIFLGNELDWFHIRFRDVFRFWPVILIAYGIYYLVRGSQRPPYEPTNPRDYSTPPSSTPTHSSDSSETPQL
jgi:hypothetical protein